jgi:hypothetical protein
MATGNFSNGGRDTHNPAKHYIGTRLQQGVPLLDRDWNELEDIRRYYERMLRLAYIGNGVPDLDGFKIVAPNTALTSASSTLRTTAPSTGINHQFVIGAGRCIVNGYDVQNERPIFFNQQPSAPTLPAPTQADTFHVYLEPSIVRVNSTIDADLTNRQDINLETCVRDRLDWAVRVARHPAQPPANTYKLATIRRPIGASVITEAMIEDNRLTRLNLAHAVDINNTQQTQLMALNTGTGDLQREIQRVRDQLARLFWDVEVTTPRPNVYFGESASVSVTVRDGAGQPVRNASLLFSTNWGYAEPPSAITNTQGIATFQVYGVEADGPPRQSDVAIMTRAANRVSAARVGNTEAVQYHSIVFQPEELSLVSLYTPRYTLADISYSLPTAPVISIPPIQTLTVTVYAKESARNFVRGIGCVQVGYRMWVRDWTRDKIFQTARVPVDVQVGVLLGRGINDSHIFDAQVVAAAMPGLLDGIHLNTWEAMRNSMFVDPHENENIFLAGSIGQAISQEATTIIGARVQNAVNAQLLQYVNDPAVVLNASQAATASTLITNSSAQYSAGRAQQNRQEFNYGGAAIGLIGFGG